MGAGGHDKQEVVINGISSLDEPSIEWGWHKHSKKIGQWVGWLFTLFLLAMIIGNHEGNVENLWVIAIALVLAIWLVLKARTPDPKVEEAKRSRVAEMPSGHYTLR